MFLRNAVREDAAPEQDNFSHLAFTCIEDGHVQKKSGSNRITPWQKRYLKLKLCGQNREPVLAYYKGKGKAPQGEVQLKKSKVGIVEQAECEKGHENSFKVETSETSEHGGRVFLFSVDNLRSAIDWVESIRRHSGQVSFTRKRPPKQANGTVAQSAPTGAGLNQTLQLQGEGKEEMTAFAGNILVRSAYSYGKWYEYWAVVPPHDSSMLILREKGGECICAIPLKGARLDEHIVNVDPSDSIQEGGTTFAVSTALTQLAFRAKDEEDKGRWAAAILANITPITSTTSIDISRK